jgi:hypothetical protein
MSSWIPAVPGGLADPNKIEPCISPFSCRFGQPKELSILSMAGSLFRQERLC